jgi:hypothetical protein
LPVKTWVFAVWKTTLAKITDEYEELPEYEIEAHKVGLKKDLIELMQRKSFWYWYDFGDDWWHKVSVLKPTKKDLSQYKGAPVCLDAFGKCPPEDVGGPWGYQNFCQIINNKKDPEYKEHREWLGMDLKSKYDYERVDIEDINKALEEYFQSKFWKRNTRDSFQKGW